LQLVKVGFIKVGLNISMPTDGAEVGLLKLPERPLSH
jgi:hypothetical protein